MNIAPLPFTRSIESLKVEQSAPVEAQGLCAPDAPSAKGIVRRSVISRLFSFGAPALTAIALSLAMGFGAPNTAYAQETTPTTTSTSSSRDAAWTAAMGSELGRGLTGDDNGGRVIGALAGLLHRLSCTNATNGTTAQALPPELQRLNTNLEEALAQPAAKYESGSELSDHQKELLTFLADRIRRDPSLRVVILGHANSGLTFINEGLAQERATKAAEFLSTKGIGGARMETSGVSQGDGQERLQIAVVKGTAPQNPQPTAETDRAEGGFLGIPGLSINIGGRNRTNNPAVINRGNGTVNGGPNVNGRTNNGGRVAPGPNNSGWNGN